MAYLGKLTFDEACAIFRTRYRMWSTKKNFPGRWKDLQCNICGNEDSDEHIFTCPGFLDVVNGVTYDMFWDQDSLGDLNCLKVMADTAMKINARLELVQKLDNA